MIEIGQAPLLCLFHKKLKTFLFPEDFNVSLVNQQSVGGVSLTQPEPCPTPLVTLRGFGTNRSLLSPILIGAAFGTRGVTNGKQMENHVPCVLLSPATNAPESGVKITTIPTVTFNSYSPPIMIL